MGCGNDALVHSAGMFMHCQHLKEWLQWIVHRKTGKEDVASGVSGHRGLSVLSLVVPKASKCANESVSVSLIVLEREE